MMLLLLLSALLLAALVARIYSESRMNNPPGPFSFPLLGSLQQGKLINTIVHQEFEKFGERYGDLIFFRLLTDEPLLIIRGFDFVYEAYHNRAFTGVGRPLTFREQGLNRRRGLAFTDGENWHEMRRFTVRTLHSQGFGRKQRSDNINDEMAGVLEQLQAAAEAREEVSARHLFTLASANSLLQLTVGQKLKRDDKLQHLIRLVDRNMRALGPAYLHLDLFPWLRHVAPELSGYRQFHNDIQELVNMFQPMLDEQKVANNDPDSNAPPRHLIEAFLRKQRHGTKADIYNDENLRAMLKDLFLAGMETTNTVMEWVLMALVRYPDVQARAAAEVDDVLGRNHLPTIDDMPSLPYLQAVIEETLRYTPAVPVTQHATTFGATQLGGYHIPAGCRVLFDLHSVLHDKAFWGDPETFRPERFLGPDAARLKKHMLGFAVGSRHCIGETHARQSLFLFTAGLLQRFKLKLSPGQVDIWDRLEPNMINKPSIFRFTVQERG